MRVVAAGDALLSPSVTRRLLERVAVDWKDAPDTSQLRALTDREREVLALVGRGLTNEEIGRELYLSPLTAKTHVLAHHVEARGEGPGAARRDRVRNGAGQGRLALAAGLALIAPSGPGSTVWPW